jgi:hypothetical protein
MLLPQAIASQLVIFFKAKLRAFRPRDALIG